MKFAFITKHRTIWPVACMCSAVGVSRSGFHAWLSRPPSQRACDDEAILANMRTSFVGRERTYGARRVWHDVLAEGVACGLHRIERIMRANAMRSRPRRRRLPKDAGERAAASPNLLERQFAADRPNRKWIADLTYSWTAEGWLYVAAVVDLFSRRVVGWSMQASMTAQLVTDALVMAIWRGGRPDALLHHPEQGPQYTSEAFQRLMTEHGVTCSMSRSGNVWDNAAMESLFSSLKTEPRPDGSTARGARRGRTCSTTSSASTTGLGGTRRSATSALSSSRTELNSLRMVSVKPAAGQFAKIRNLRAPSSTRVVCLGEGIDWRGHALHARFELQAEV